MPAATDNKTAGPHHKIPQPSKEQEKQVDEVRKTLLKQYKEDQKPNEQKAEDQRKEEVKAREALIESAPVVAPWQPTEPGYPRVEIPVRPLNQDVSGGPRRPVPTQE